MPYTSASSPSSFCKSPTRSEARMDARDWAWRTMEARAPRRAYALTRTQVEERIAREAEASVMDSYANCFRMKEAGGQWVRRTAWDKVEVISTSLYQGRIEEETNKKVKEYRQVLAAKRRARKLGIRYWPALLWNIQAKPEDRVDPRAFLAAEAILAKAAGAFWGDLDPQTGKKSHGGWDSEACYGPSAWAVAQMWRAAGCCDSEKFRVQVRTGVVAGKGMTLPETIHFCRGQRWAARNFHRPDLRLSGKAVTALGRLSPVLRWAAVSGLTSYHHVRVRELNWAEVARMQSLPRYKQAEAPYLPVKVSWALQGYVVPVGCKEYLSGLPRRLAVPSALMPALGKEEFASLAIVSSEFAVPALAVAALFRREARRWVDVHGGHYPQVCIYNTNPLWAWHDVGQKPMLIEPDAIASEEDRAAWARLCWVTKGAALDYAASWRDVAEFLGKVPRTLAELRKAAVQVKYGAAASPAEELLQVRAAEAILSKAQYESYRNLIMDCHQPSYERVPYVRVAGEEVALEGDWVLERIDSDDPIGPMLGLLTNCCQHLDGAAHSCAARIWDHPRASAWVVRYKGSVVAQSYVWVHQKSLVIDSVEALGSAYVEGIAHLYKEAANRVLGKLGVREVLMGDTRYGITRAVARLVSDGISRVTSGCPSQYSDAHHACLVASCEKPQRQRRFPKVDALVRAEVEVS